ncbi:MAG: putative toxin-antitoxin system toxin component, PIN family [Candidatus Altiarchaeales archaeon]|nr:putative toxin-antitoxin system toxin component, PIN family [Candidatus Altiarchaeales archaeon]MBD3416168.1 putative toxin-antitoxin system toxin component, PIN family [Candidatus Altiarchaeales archaeon]
MVKIVLDTNLLVAGRWNKRSSSSKILELCLKGTLTPVYTSEIKKENLYILGKVKPPKEYMDMIGKFYKKGKRVKSPKNRITASVDKSDNRFLEAAVSGRADYVISNDHHLLDLKEYDGIRILRPAAFMRMFP